MFSQLFSHVFKCRFCSYFSGVFFKYIERLNRVFHLVVLLILVDLVFVFVVVVPVLCIVCIVHYIWAQKKKNKEMYVFLNLKTSLFINIITNVIKKNWFIEKEPRTTIAIFQIQTNCTNKWVLWTPCTTKLTFFCNLLSFSKVLF